MKQRIILHIDFDYFYAQCEEVRKPELKTSPVVVCMFSDRGGDSGAVATANYIARKYGVNSGLSIKFAKENNDKKTIIKYMVTNLGFEKYNTKYNYFFVSE